MDRDMLMKYRNLFESEKNKLVYTHGVNNEDFHLKRDDLLDDVDLTTSELETSMRMRLRNREAIFLKKIGEALKRIEEGTFGECEACGEEIEPRRLEARPTTTKCVACKEAEERLEHNHIDSRRSKSLGIRIRLAHHHG